MRTRRNMIGFWTNATKTGQWGPIPYDRDIQQLTVRACLTAVRIAVAIPVLNLSAIPAAQCAVVLALMEEVARRASIDIADIEAINKK